MRVLVLSILEIKNKIAIDGGYTPVDGIALDKRKTTPVEITVYKKNGRKITSLQASQFILGIEFCDNRKKGTITVPR
jgi:hypothetical protein